MGERIEQIKNSTLELSEKSGHMDEVKGQVEQDLFLFDGVNQTILTDVSDTNEQINITNASVGQMQELIEMIKDISSQTNLLSLNASIEAAHAGEAGKGFAVVATEIRQLAEQSAQSSAEIENALTDLLENYNRIIAKMNVTTGNVNEQSEKLGAMKDNFAALGNDIHETVAQIKSIDTMVEHLNSERKSVVDKVCSLSAISEENAASCEETTASIEELSATMTQVQEKAENVNKSANELLSRVRIFSVE